MCTNQAVPSILIMSRQTRIKSCRERTVLLYCCRCICCLICSCKTRRLATGMLCICTTTRSALKCNGATGNPLNTSSKQLLPSVNKPLEGVLQLCAIGLHYPSIALTRVLVKRTPLNRHMTYVTYVLSSCAFASSQLAGPSKTCKQMCSKRIQSSGQTAAAISLCKGKNACQRKMVSFRKRDQWMG